MAVTPTGPDGALWEDRPSNPLDAVRFGHGRASYSFGGARNPITRKATTAIVTPAIVGSAAVVNVGVL